ncbi:MAG: serine/threonine protein kinase [Eggerthellaceae bacterium]|nr:serine/threonine protein kinase [Eggerthellaceae bacterium]
MARPLILNRYRPKGEVGKGSFSTVVAAWDTMLQRDVAIKCVALDKEMPKTSNDDMSKGFGYDENLAPMQIPGLIEARTAAKLSNANIVSIYDFMVEGDTAYVIMEYVEGVTLADLINYHNRKDIDFKLTLPMISKILGDVSNALAFAHKHNVLHLDIKPANIIVSPNGVAKVTDFGLAILLDAQGGGHCGGGSIGYMPPEQIRNERLSVQTDLWALASVCYEMLTGKNFFKTNRLNKAEALIYNAELELPSYYHYKLSDQANDVIFAALSPNAKERHESIMGFFKDLEYYLPDQAAGKRDLSRAIKNSEATFACVLPQEEHAIALAEAEDKKGLLNKHKKKNLYEEFDGVPQGDDKTKKVNPNTKKGNKCEPEKQCLPPGSNVSTKSFLAFFEKKIIREIIYRGISAIGALVLASIASGNLQIIGGPSNQIFWIVVLIIAGAAAALPFAGIYASILILGISLVFATAYIPGLALIVLSSIFLLFIYIRVPKTAACTAAFFALALLNLGPIALLVSGNILNFAYSIAASSMSVIVALVLFAASAHSFCTFNILECLTFKGDISANFILIISNPGFWILALCFIAASVCTSFAFQNITSGRNESRGNRLLVFALSCVGVALIVGGTVLNFIFTGGFHAIALAFTILSGFIYLLLIAAKLFVK